jgi:iron complex outermembrane receptor protein
MTGMSAAVQKNRISGRGFIIPSFNQFNTGGYIFLKHSFSPVSTLQAGIRYDQGQINTMEYSDWFTSPVITGSDTTMQYVTRAEDLRLRMSSFTWSAGYAYNPGIWSLKLNAGKSFRLPTPKELAANGVNYHNFSYEVGDPGLSPEVSYQLDVTVEYAGDRFTFGLNPFVNYFPNYIYLNPSSEHDRLYGTGNQVFYYTQSRVFRTGGELQGTFILMKTLHVGVTGEYVFSEQLSGAKKGFSLPFSPPASMTLNMKYNPDRLLFVRHPYLSADLVMTAGQENIVPPEEPTDGYMVLNLGAGFEFAARENRATVSMQIINLLNKKYFNHTSYYRLINLPEPGRGFVLNITIPFSAKSLTDNLNY